MTPFKASDPKWEIIRQHHIKRTRGLIAALKGQISPLGRNWREGMIRYYERVLSDLEGELPKEGKR